MAKLQNAHYRPNTPFIFDLDIECLLFLEIVSRALRTLLNFLADMLKDHLEDVNSVAFESPHDKTNKMTCAPSGDLDQPGHPPRLISLRYALNG